MAKKKAYKRSVVTHAIDKTTKYPIAEAVALVKQHATAKFDETIEMHVRLGIEPRKSDQQIRATAELPHGTGKKMIIAAFVGPNDTAAAKAAGADLVFGEEDIKSIQQTGKIAFDLAVATPEMMPKLAPAARVLGPRGLMPNPKTDTVSPDVTKMIEALRKGKVTLKNDATANLHQSIGKKSFDDTKLIENYTSLLDTLKKNKPSASKGLFIKEVYLASTMGPSVRVEVER
jgi:large subunit ribosomal protein L1